jgi:hypothetical protein
MTNDELEALIAALTIQGSTVRLALAKDLRDARRQIKVGAEQIRGLLVACELNEKQLTDRDAQLKVCIEALKLIANDKICINRWCTATEALKQIGAGDVR